MYHNLSAKMSQANSVENPGIRRRIHELRNVEKGCCDVADEVIGPTDFLRQRLQF